jgi:hypothetical protein
VVSETEVEEYRLQFDADCGDWTVYEGTREELIGLAKHTLAHAPTGARGTHQRKTAQSILEYLE